MTVKATKNGKEIRFTSVSNNKIIELRNKGYKVTFILTNK